MLDKSSSDVIETQKNILDLFSGAGGLSFGISQYDSNYNIVGAIDHSEDAIKTFNKNHSGDKDVGKQADISEYGPEEYSEDSGLEREDIDIIVGGPPCKGFSSVRPDRGENNRDDRNYLYQFFFNYVKNYEPDFFVMENVPSIVSHTNDDGNRIFDSIIDRCEELGYSYDWNILNAAHYGVPQVRSRFVLIGCKNNCNIKFPNPIFKIPSDINVKKQSELMSAGDNLPDARNIESIVKDLPVLQDTKQRLYVKYLREKDPSLTYHTATDSNETMKKRMSMGGTKRGDIPDYIFPSSGYSTTYSRLFREQPSTTITTTFTLASSTRCIHPYEPRPLSIREAARIQSFPDHFEFEGSRGSITTQIGNAVPPLMGRAIGKSLSDIIESC
jgi:DNA (cytosine-5)-methyltransferase 1